jgi:5-methylcytosine-specific restriction endonuclease McrA
MSHDLRATRDHLVPRAAGGAGTIDNLVLACRRCNCERGDTPAELWAVRQQGGATA